MLGFRWKPRVRLNVVPKRFRKYAGLYANFTKKGLSSVGGYVGKRNMRYSKNFTKGNQSLDGPGFLNYTKEGMKKANSKTKQAVTKHVEPHRYGAVLTIVWSVLVLLVASLIKIVIDHF